MWARTQNSNLTVETLEHISTELDDAEADRIMKESRMRDFNSMNPDMEALMGDDPTIGALYTQLTTLQTQRAQLATKYGPKHPAMQQIDLDISKVQAQINKESELARKQVQDEYQAAVQLEDALRSRLGDTGRCGLQTQRRCGAILDAPPPGRTDPHPLRYFADQSQGSDHQRGHVGGQHHGC